MEFKNLKIYVLKISNLELKKKDYHTFKVKERNLREK
jgi:hypothetical protein